MFQLFTRRNIIIGLLAVACIVSFFTFYTYKNIRKTVAQTQKVDERLNTLQSIDNVIDDLQDIESGQRGYTISRGTLFLSSYHQAFRKLQRDTVSLRELLGQFPGRKDQYDQVMRLVDRKIAFALRTVDIVLQRKEDEIILLIKDDGKGFNIKQSSKGIGISNIYKRARYYNGDVTLQSAPGKGCVLEVRLPFDYKQGLGH